MAQTVSLRAQSRATKGKGAARSLRRSGTVPAVLYGQGRDPEALQVDAQALGRLLQGISAGSTLVDVSVDARAPVKALIREIQRHPLRAENILHLDLYEVRADQPVSVEVALHLTGTADGVRNHGGVLDQQLYSLTLRVLPSEIPSSIDVDVTNLGIGQSLHVSDITVPAGKVENDAGQTIVIVQAPRAEEEATPAAAAEATSTEPELIRKPKAEEEAAE